MSAVLMGMATMQTRNANDTLGSLLIEGLSSELDFMTADEAAEARALEAELIADAQAGVDVRVRLIGWLCS